ncbi:peptidoglycan D,D-transpeptidase FtsI family protein [Galbitalea soli]|uniref:Penicillin-binding protein 2 n=1 Tax=Galbitalea soli TaxID=1268042 RepID=A0A7C9PL94_9MICO|nr:penicillin-binding protein 2 [Galbitalea soli]NEM90006.1 penicillin-binding protein 2 [Galbitalea soli]NYJ30713.1 cell division protein FtsI (penicillin-binding protein 3) [Galbitalea soli]
MKKSRSARARLAVTIVVIVAIVVIFSGRLFDLQVIQGPTLAAKAQKDRSTQVTTYGTRGAIEDTNGNVLADSVDRFDITVAPINVKLDGDDSYVKGVKVHTSFESELQSIAAITGQTTDELRAAITADPKANFAYLTKAVTLDVFTRVQALHIPWIYYEPHPARTYPNGAIAGNLVGFVGTDGPQAGIELKENSCLAPTNGTSTYEKGEDGVRIPGSTVTQKNPKDGGTIKLTIDRDMQWFAQQTIAQRAQQIGAKWATAVVVRVADNHLMAVADYPTVDPNNVSAANPAATGSRAFAIPYEPGSTFKAMSAASMIDAGVITPTTKITLPSLYRFPDGAYIKDSFPHGVLKYTTAGVLENSSNIGISILSEKLDAQSRRDYMLKFGVGQKTAVGFGGESSGHLGAVSSWDEITNRAVEFGQGVSATSVQVAQIFSTLANHGVHLPLTLVEGCYHADGTVTDKPSTKATRVISAQAADETVQMLETVVSSGPNSPVLKIPGYRIAAKTGTAQVAGPNGYTDDRVISVAGIAPAENPKYVVLVTFGEPSTVKVSAAAAPAFRKLMIQVLKKYRIPPSTVPAPFIQTTW